jgi:ABC-type sugar transport system ATPase subunit
VDWPELQRRASVLLADVGAHIDPARAMLSLSVAEQQQVQIAAAIGGNARVIVFDEPTSSLGESEANALYDLVATLKSRGVTMLFVSHRMPEIFRLCDAITVLRDGQHVATQPTSAVDEAALVQQMIGRELAQFFPHGAEPVIGEERLRVQNLSSHGHFSGVSFSVHAGEVVGLAGLVGAGRSEVAQAIFGLDDAVTGELFVRGRRVEIRSPRDAMREGIGFVPEDRKKQGLVLNLQNRENASLPTLERFASYGWVDDDAELTAVQSVFDRVLLRSTSGAITSSLSGGNQQKVVLSKWLTAESDILMLDEPTRGVDVGAKSELHGWIAERAAQGAAILLISSELPELLSVSTRIIVLREGHVQGELRREEATQDRLLRMMTAVA